MNLSTKTFSLGIGFEGLELQSLHRQHLDLVDLDPQPI